MDQKSSAYELENVHSIAPSLAVHLSAPSHLVSLVSSQEPPFRKPEPVSRRLIFLDYILTVREAKDLLELVNDNGSVKLLMKDVVKRQYKRRSYEERKMILNLFLECYRYSVRNELDARRLSTLVSLYGATHEYFSTYYWLTPREVWNYFEKAAIRHCYSDPPSCLEVFTSPEECYDIITHFHTIYITNLPLIHVVTFGVTTLKLTL